jgi:hypothetical protein
MPGVPPAPTCATDDRAVVPHGAQRPARGRDSAAPATAASLQRPPAVQLGSGLIHTPRHPEGERLVEEILTEQRIKEVSSRFELAVSRIIDGWLESGRVNVSKTDVLLAREFLEENGWRLEDVPGARVRVVKRDGRTQEMTREATVMAALRKLATKV